MRVFLIKSFPDDLFHIMNSSCKFFLPGLLSLVLLGCGSGQNGSNLPDTEAAAAQLNSAFGSTDNSKAKQASEALSQALVKQDYESAFKAVNDLQQTEAQNMDQVVAAENAHRRFQADLLRAVEAGDPKAIQVWNAMKGTRRN